MRRNHKTNKEQSQKAVLSYSCCPPPAAAPWLPSVKSILLATSRLQRWRHRSATPPTRNHTAVAVQPARSNQNLKNETFVGDKQSVSLVEESRLCNYKPRFLRCFWPCCEPLTTAAMAPFLQILLPCIFSFVTGRPDSSVFDVLRVGLKPTARAQQQQQQATATASDAAKAKKSSRGRVGQLLGAGG